jgi:hypothetical protein
MVQTMARQSDGKLIIGGRCGVARLNVDGTFDPEFGFVFTNGEVLGVRILSTGKIMVGAILNPDKA